MKNLKPPKWAPYAIATEKGWVNPKTGELLVCLRGLKSMIEKEQPTVILEIETPAECLVENTFVEITTEEAPVIVEVVTEEPIVEVEVVTEPSLKSIDVQVDPIPKETREAEVIPEKRGRGRPKKTQTST